MQNFLPKLPRPPTTTPRMSSPQKPYQLQPPEPVPPLDQPTPVTHAEFDQRYQDWGRGSKAEFTVYDYLSNRLHLIEMQDFSFLPSGYAGGLAKFYVGPMVWRIQGDSVILNNTVNKLENAQLENRGYRVVDLQATALEQDGENTITRALRGLSTDQAGTQTASPSASLTAAERSYYGLG